MTSVNKHSIFSNFIKFQIHTDTISHYQRSFGCALCRLSV